MAQTLGTFSVELHGGAVYKHTCRDPLLGFHNFSKATKQEDSIEILYRWPGERHRGNPQTPRNPEAPRQLMPTVTRRILDVFGTISVENEEGTDNYWLSCGFVASKMSVKRDHAVSLVP